MTARLQIVDPGILSLVEDLGRPGNAAIGISRSGALDRGALRLANRLVGNPETAAGLEVLAGGLVARFTESAWFAVSGALGTVRLEEPTRLGQDHAVPGAPIESHAPILASAGAILRFGRPEVGLRYYLAVRGGIETPTVLGSRSADLLSGIGGEQLSAGDVLPIGAEPSIEIPAVDALTVVPPASGEVTVFVYAGPRSDWFTDAGRGAFFNTKWMVSPDANRVGVRLQAVGSSDPAGAADSADAAESGGAHPTAGVTLLQRAVPGELPSEAMVPGAIQVSSSGQPTVLLADHPATGGYPVIAVVADGSLDVFAQLRPGQRIVFRHAALT
ncbi:MAG: biotin-dependent carboxyltransferase family protein [Microbacteriaceae bacterium]